MIGISSLPVNAKALSEISSLSVMIVAGDISGDIHASSVVKQLFSDFPGSKIWGIGGPAMQKEGFNALMPFEPFNRMGFVEVFKNLPFFLDAKKKLVREMVTRKPNCLICVDYPGFNMPLLKVAYKLGIPVIWYIAPMVWAWKQKRAVTLARYASHIACIFPFEVQYFSPFTSNVSFVGNPLVEAIEKENGEVLSSEIKATNMAIVPGSRWQEVENTLVPMIDSYKELKKSFPQLQGTISHCGRLPIGFYQNAIKDTDLKISDEPLRTILSRSQIALVTSGTATLETALLGVPLVTAYKTSWINYTLFKNFLKIPYISLPNIIAGERIIPECIQYDMTAQKMAEELRRLLSDQSLYSSTKKRLIGLSNLLGSKKPSLQLSSILKSIVEPSANF